MTGFLFLSAQTEILKQVQDDRVPFLYTPPLRGGVYIPNNKKAPQISGAFSFI
jgi:hypothetical protein